ncbi:MAG: hypothetical protein AAFY48_12870 [Bacteroidota bacterium]
METNEQNEQDLAAKADVGTQVNDDVNDFINNMSTPVEETEFDIADIMGTEDTEEASQENPGSEQKQSDDFYDYDREDEEAAYGIWELFDRGQAFACAVLAREPMERFQKITEDNPPSKRAIRITAALLKKYSLNFKLEHQLIMIVIAMYGPNLFGAAVIRSQKAKEQKESKSTDG